MVSFYCSSPSVGELICDGSGSNYINSVPLTGFDWQVNGQSYSGVMVNISGLTERQASVSLTITDELGLSSSQSMVYEVLQNDLPQGDFSCASSGIWELYCYADYSDNDGEVVSYEWSVDGQNFSGKTLSLILGRGGEVSVSLVVKDNLGSEVTQVKAVQVVENQAPVAVIDIDKNGKLVPAYFYLSAGNSSDQDGSISKYEWVLEDGSVIEGDSLGLEVLETKMEAVELVVTDNLGATTHTQLNVFATEGVNNEILFTKDQDTLPSTWTLEAYNKTDFFGNSLGFEWKINGETVSTKDRFSYTENYEFLSNITLISRDIFGNESVTELEVSLVKPELFFTLDSDITYGVVGDELKVRLREIEEQQELVFSFDYNQPGLYCDIIDFEISCSSSISGEFLVEITASLNDLFYSRTLELNFGEPIFSESIVINENEYPLVVDGKVLVSLKTQSERAVDIVVAESGDTYIVSFLSDEEGDKPIILNSFSEDYDISINNVKQYGFSQFANGDNYTLLPLPLSTIGGLNQVSVCPNLDRVRKTIDGIQKTFIFKRKDNNAKGFADIFKKTTIGNQDFFMDPELVKKYILGNLNNNFFNLDFIAYPELRFLRGLFNNPNPLVRLNGPVYLLHKDNYRNLGLSNSPSGFVSEGVGAIFLSSLMLKPADKDNNLGYFTHQFFVHENFHLREQASDCAYLKDMENVEYFSKHIIHESLAQLEAVDAALGITPAQLGNVGISSKYNQSQFGGFVDSSKNINDSLKEYLTGLDSNRSDFHYSFSLHLSSLKKVGSSAMSEIKKLIKSYGLDNKLNIFEYLENDPTYANDMMTLLKEISLSSSYQNIGFSLSDASVELTDGVDFEIAKLGFGYLKIPYAKILPALMYSGAIFKIRVETNTALDYEFFSPSNPDISYISSVDGASTVHQLYLNPSLQEDIYIRVVNRENSRNSFRVSTFEAFCLDEEGVFDSSTKTCVRCDLENDGVVQNGQCLYQPQSIVAGQYASNGLFATSSSAYHTLEEVCLGRIDAGYYYGAFAVTESYNIEWTCNGAHESKSFTRRHGTCIISPPGIINEVISDSNISYTIDCGQPESEVDVLYIPPISN